MKQKECDRHFKNAMSMMGGLSEEDLVTYCDNCKHYIAENRCKAFNDKRGIPVDVMSGSVPHDRKLKSQRGNYIFEPKERNG